MGTNRAKNISLIAFTAAIGGFLLGYDGSVISGAAPFYKTVFGLEDGSLLFGFSVSCLIWGCIFGNLFAGSLSDKYGRKTVLLIAAILFLVSSLITAFAANIFVFILGRILAGIAVGFAILTAPVYIAEVSPPGKRGWLVSFNQLLIVIGLSSAYFVNYFILKINKDPNTNWRWMLGVEAVPSLIYFFMVILIPESPRWLVLKGKTEKALAILTGLNGDEFAKEEIENIGKTMNSKKPKNALGQIKELFKPKMRLILIIGIGLGIFQHVSGINSVLYYAPMIFESAGNGRDAAFIQATAIGIVFLIVTVISMYTIDRFGRKPLLYIGVSLMALSLLITGLCFKQASYSLSKQKINETADQLFISNLNEQMRSEHPELVGTDNLKMNSKGSVVDGAGTIINLSISSSKLNQFNETKELFIKRLSSLEGVNFNSDLSFQQALLKVADRDSVFNAGVYMPMLSQGAIRINGKLVMISILGFIAGFSLSLGPVMWAMFSEIFPNRIRAVAISLVGTVNSLTSFIVATFFPFQIKVFGSSNTFFLYAACMLLCILFVWRYVVETKGKSLEQIEQQLVGQE